MEKLKQLLVGNKRWLIAVTCFISVPLSIQAQNDEVPGVPTSTVVIDGTQNVVMGDFSAYTGKCCTVYLPVGLDAVTAASWGDFYAFAGIEGSTVKFEKVTRTEANTAYLFRPVAAKVSAANVEVMPVATHSEDIAAPEFEGTYMYKTLANDEEFDYYSFVGSKLIKGQFVKVTSNVAVNPYSAYIKVPRVMNAPARLNVDWNDGTTTDLDDISGVDGDNDPALYDLNGTVVDPCYIPLPQSPTPKGIYIYHKKKLVID